MINSNTYTEVYEILSYMDKQTVMKVPIDILNYIKDNRNKEYTTCIDENDIFNMNNISSETKHVLAWIDVNYWMSEEKKKYIKEKVYKINTFSDNSANVFKKENSQISNDTKIIEYRESIFIRLINKIKRMFTRN